MFSSSCVLPALHSGGKSPKRKEHWAGQASLSASLAHATPICNYLPLVLLAALEFIFCRMKRQWQEREGDKNDASHRHRKLERQHFLPLGFYYSSPSFVSGATVEQGMTHSTKPHRSTLHNSRQAGYNFLVTASCRVLRGPRALRLDPSNEKSIRYKCEFQKSIKRKRSLEKNDQLVFLFIAVDRFLKRTLSLD